MDGNKVFVGERIWEQVDPSSDLDHRVSQYQGIEQQQESGQALVDILRNILVTHPLEFFVVKYCYGKQKQSHCSVQYQHFELNLPQGNLFLDYSLINFLEQYQRLSVHSSRVIYVPDGI